MSTKINIQEYNLDVTGARAYVAFMLWIAANPNGGTFEYEEIKIKITKHDTTNPHTAQPAA